MSAQLYALAPGAAKVVPMVSALTAAANTIGAARLGHPRAVAEITALQRRAQAGDPSAQRAWQLYEGANALLPALEQRRRATVSGAGDIHWDIGWDWGDVWDAVKGVASVIPGVGQTVATAMSATELAAKQLQGGGNGGGPIAASVSPEVRAHQIALADQIKGLEDLVAKGGPSADWAKLQLTALRPQTRYVTRVLNADGRVTETEIPA